MTKPISGRVLRRQLDFFENLSFALGAGLSLQEAVFSAADCVKDEDEASLAGIYQALGSHLRRGRSFASSLAACLPGLSEAQVAIVSGGEKSGTMVPSLNFLLRQLREGMDDRRQLAAALVYPLAVILLAVAGSLAFSLVWAGSRLGVAADPVSLRSLLLANLMVLAFLALTGSGILVLALAENGGAAWQQSCRRFTRRLPLFGSLLVFRELRQFCTLASQLCAAGLAFADAMELACRSLPALSPLRQQGLAAVLSIRKGSAAAAALQAARAWPARVSSWLAMAERTGQPAKAFDLLAAYYHERYSARRQLLVRSAEPAGIILAGLCILPVLAAFVGLITSAGSALLF